MSIARKLAEKLQTKKSFDERMNEGGILFWFVVAMSAIGLFLLLTIVQAVRVLFNI